MNYDQFRAEWHEALREAGMGVHIFPPEETVDLRDMSRGYEVHALLGRAQEVEPFTVSVQLGWTWDAMLSARMATTEEDTLMMLLGDERRHEDTERPWLRVDVALRATLPWGSPLPLPAPAHWSTWVAEVAHGLEELLPDEWAASDEQVMVFASRNEPEATVAPAADGTLSLLGVELEAWELVALPREWDDPERWQDEDPYEQLVDLFERVWEALEVWNGTLVHLLAGEGEGEAIP